MEERFLRSRSRKETKKQRTSTHRASAEAAAMLSTKSISLRLKTVEYGARQHARARALCWKSPVMFCVLRCLGDMVFFIFFSAKGKAREDLSPSFCFSFPLSFPLSLSLAYLPKRWPSPVVSVASRPRRTLASRTSNRSSSRR